MIPRVLQAMNEQKQPRRSSPPRSLAQKTTLVAAAAVVAVAVLSAGFTAGRHTAPIQEGYILGNEDGYSTGYNDGRNGAPPAPRRFMTKDDYAVRTAIGARAIGE